MKLFSVYLSGKAMKKPGCRWIIDSGASKHMKNDSGILRDYHQFSNPKSVYMADNSTFQALGGGNCVQTEWMSSSRNICTISWKGHSPQLNVIAERFNQNFFTKVRAMMLTAGAPSNFWELQLQLPTTHAIAHLPLKLIESRTKSGSENINFLRVWGL